MSQGKWKSSKPSHLHNSRCAPKSLSSCLIMRGGVEEVGDNLSSSVARVNISLGFVLSTKFIKRHITTCVRIHICGLDWPMEFSRCVGKMVWR
jgi:hypothetical protein